MGNRTQHEDPPITSRDWLRSLAQRERKRLTGAAACGVLAGSQTIVLLVGMAWLIDQLVVHDRSPTEFKPLMIGLVLAVVLRAALQWGQDVLSAEASLRIRQFAREELLTKIAELGPVWLTQQQSGGLATQAVEHIEALDGYFARFFPQLRIVVVLPVLIACVVAWLDYLVAAFLVFSAPLIPLFMALVGMGAERLNREQFVAVSRLSAHFIDRVRGMTTLQLFGYTRKAQQAVWYATDEYRKLSMRTLRLAFLSSAVLEFFASVAIAVVAMYVGFGLLGYINYGPSPEITLFSGLAVLLLAPEFFQPLRTLSQHYHDRAAALGAAENIVTIMRQRARVPKEVPAPNNTQIACELVSATLGYEGKVPVFDAIDLSVTEGEVVALTGKSGSGKSTLLAVLAGFIAPLTGECYRRSKQVAWLDQTPCIIQGTLADNLRLAQPAASEASMMNALQRAGLGSLFHQLPAGLESPIGERGVGLSGGQAQRLALARVYLSEASLIVLDEPTASLDASTEKMVLKALLEWGSEGRTLIIATHHPVIVQAATRHFVCANGKLNEVTT